MKVSLKFGIKVKGKGDYQFYGPNSVRGFEMDPSAHPEGSTIMFRVPGTSDDGRWTFYSFNEEPCVDSELLYTRVLKYEAMVSEDTSRIYANSVYLEIVDQEPSEDSAETQSDDWRLNSILKFQLYKEAMRKASEIELSESDFDETMLAYLQERSCRTVADAAKLNWSLISRHQLTSIHTEIEEILEAKYELRFAA